MSYRAVDKRVGHFDRKQSVGVEILPQTEQPIRTVFSMTRACDETKEYLEFSDLVLTITYSDSANGRQYVQRFREHIALSLLIGHYPEQ